MSFFSAEGCPIWIKFRRLVQNDMSSVDCGDVWKWKLDVEFQYGGCFGKFNGMSSQSHVSHCRVMPLGEFTVTILEPHATLQRAVNWWNQCCDHATLQGVEFYPPYSKSFFAIFYFCFWCSLGVDEWRLSHSLPIHLFQMSCAAEWVTELCYCEIFACI